MVQLGVGHVLGAFGCGSLMVQLQPHLRVGVAHGSIDGLVLGVCGWAGAAVRASVLRPWVCSSCGRLEISLSLGGVPGQRLGPGMWCPPPYAWDSGEKATWARARDIEKKGNGLN